ncbi:MAG TPA: hypothetical protein PKC92_12205 [Bacteroidia bacterium]|nr:hypothetical protein [Bacteroidia bacterium]
MKNQILTTIIAIALCMVCGITQAQTTLYYTSPDTLRACDVNRFSVSLVNPATDTIIITPQLNFPNGTVASCTTSGSGINYIFESVSGGSATTLQTGSTLRFVLNGTDTVTYTYRAEIDCHVIMIDSSAGLVKLQQDFTGSNTYVIHPGNSNSTEQVVNYTKLTELNAGNNFYVNYQQDTTWLFYYKNTLSHRTNIGFTFNVNTALPCTGLLFDPVIRFSNGLHGQSFVYSNNTAADTILLNAADTLVIRVKVKATNCVSCSGMNAAFSYRCNQSLSGCSTCEHSFVHAYTANMNDKPKIDVLRVSPQQVIYDNSCINDTTQTTLWSYILVNTGNCAIDSVQFDLTQLGDAAWDVRRLMLMPRKSLVIEKTSLSHCTIDTVLELKSQHLCADLVDTAVYSCLISIKNFYPGDTVHLQFALLRCSQDTSVLMNAYKYYNAWMFKGLKTRSICGVTQPVATASGFAGGVMLAGQTGSGTYDVHLQNQFYPSVSDMSVSNSGTGEKATFNVRLQSILNNGKAYVYQLLGCNQPQQQCTTLNGWLRATVVCDTNLTIPNAYSDAFMITLSATGDTTFYKPYYYDITQDSLSCEAKQYHYYFNLADSGMRTVIDSGRFVYTLQACCNSDTDPTPYKAEFHLLADAGNCFTINLPTASNFHYQEPSFNATDGIAQWLPLSRAGNFISIHCPGCKILGIIVDHYRMERNTYGLQDSDNDHRADSATAAIDPTGNWFAQNKNNLSSTTLAFGDRSTDYLRAHVQPGDPGNDGYSYAMMKALGLRLNALQLSRIMPLALDTMMVVPDTLTFYIDDPTDSIGGCLECEPFGAGADDYITLLKIEVTGTAIAQYFLKTNTALNEYLYSFTSFFDSTAVSDTGNLHNTTWHVPTGSSRSFHGFEEGQSIRMKVSYHVCGNFNPQGDLTAENTFRQSHIQNTMWLSGKKQPHSQVPQMEQSLTLLQDSMNITIYDTLSPPYNLMDTGYVNNRLFFCETRGNFAYFAATTFRNKTIITNKNIFQCRKRMEINMSSGYCNNAQVYDAYPFEYRSPLIAGQSVNVNVPPGYEIIQATSKHKVPIGNNFFQTMPVDITAQLPNTTGNFSLNTTPFIATHCLTSDTTAQNLTTGITAYMGDQFYEHTITLDMMPIACTTDTAFNNSSSTVVTFGNQAAPCQSFYGCQNTTATATNSSNAVEDFTLAPQLTSMGIGNSLATGIGDTVCWNNLVLINTTKDNADNVFLSAVNSPAYLSQWHYISHPSNSIIQANGDVIGLTPTLAQNILLSGNVCAVMDSCPPLQDTLQFYLCYGWNCKNFPATPFTVDSVCFTDSVPLRFTRAAYELVTASWSQTSSFSLCDTLFAEAKFQNGKAGFVYPFQVTLPGYDPRLQIIAAMACSNTDTVGLTPTAASDVWTVTADSLLVLLGSTGIHNSQYVTIRFLMVAPCGFGMNVTDVLPAIQMAAQSICNDTLTASSRLMGAELPAFAWDSTSHCPDCWSITKTAGTDTAAAFTDTVTYTITVCNNSVNTQTGILSDITPTGFVTTSTTLPPTITLNSMECDTFTVSGYFTSPGSCFYNVASVTSPMGTTWKDSVCVNVLNTCANTDTTFADSTFSGTATINNKSIYVEGRFYVNNILNLNSCTVYTAAGAQIIVQNGGALTLNNTIIQACDTMWRGIEVLENGTVTLNGSTIRDAENGILLRNKGIVKSVNSNFYDNIIGINAQPELSLSDVYGFAHLTVIGTTFTKMNGFKPDFIQQYPHGTVPYCGILLQKIFCTIGDDNQNENYFSKMIYGIFSNNSDLTLTNSRFQYIYNHNSWMSKAKGTAVVSWGNSQNKLSSLKMRPVVSSNATIEQCDRGLYTTYSAVDVNRLIIKQVLTGMFTANCYGRDAKIGYNTIEAKSYGVYLSRNEGSTSMDIEGNDITMQGSSKGVGITMDEWSNVQSANYNINANSITLWDAAFGIRSSYALKPQINYNNIYQYTMGSLKPATTGIAILGSDTATISCNYMTTNYPADTNFVSIGIEIAQSKMFTANCNKIRYHNCGVYMGGDCQNNNIYRTNDVDSCDMGLYLNSAAIVGQQMQKGNRWLNVLNKVNAANFGDPSLSPIKIHTPVNTIWHPLNISPNGPWFISDTTGTPEQCGNSCYAAFTAAEDTLLLYSIARGDTLSTDFVEETKSIARQNLYDLLAQNDTLRLSDTVLTLFYNIHQTTDIGKFYTVKDSIKAASTMNGYLNTLLQLNDSLILQTKDSITIADSLMATDSLFYSTYKEQLIMQLNTLQSNAASLLLQLQNIQQSLWVNIKSDNQTISPAEIPEQNRKTMNDILASVWEDAADSLPGKYPALMAIALQCPYSGGVSVYQARNMLRLLDDSIQYDDRYSCLQQGIYRMGSTHDVMKNYAAIDFDLVPNPANGKTEVRILTPVDGLTKLTLRTMLGEMLEEWLLQNEKQFTIYTHHYLQGIYVVEAKDKQGFSRVKKLIIAR